jgi:hypothetical protein
LSEYQNRTWMEMLRTILQAVRIEAAKLYRLVDKYMRQPVWWNWTWSI